MRTTEKMQTVAEGQPIQEPMYCIAIRGKLMIDTVNPRTGLTAIYGKTMEDCQAEPGYAGA